MRCSVSDDTTPGLRFAYPGAPQLCLYRLRELRRRTKNTGEVRRISAPHFAGIVPLCWDVMARLLDHKPGCLRFELLWQNQSEHAIDEFCIGTGFVDVLSKLEAA